MSEPDPLELDRPAEPDWQRLDPRIVLAAFLRALVRLVPAAVAWLVFGQEEGFGRSTVIVLTVVAIGSPIQQALRYVTVRYRLSDTELQLESGLLSRSSQRIPLHRIRTVDITAPLVQRVLGLAVLVVGTGENRMSELGSGATLDGLSAPVAQELRTVLLRAPAVGVPEVDTQASDEPSVASSRAEQHLPPETWPTGSAGPAAARTVQTLRWRWAIHNLVGVWVFAGPVAVAGSVWSAAQAIGIQPDEQVEDVLTDLVERGAPVVLAGALLAAVLVVGVATGLAQFVEAWWGYRLVDEGSGRFVATRGLLTTRSFTADRDRMRGVTLREPLLMRLLGGARMSLVMTGVSKQQETAQTAVMLPAADRPDAVRVADELLGAPVLRPEVFGPDWFVSHPPAARRRALLRHLAAGGAIVVAVAVIAVALDQAWWWAVPTAAVVLPCAVHLALRWYANLGHRLDDDHVYLRRGYLNRRTDAIALRGINAVSVAQTFFQRRSGLATLTLATAAGDQGYYAVDLDLGDATRLAALLSEQPTVAAPESASLPAELVPGR